MTKTKRKKRADPITIAEPTPEQQAKGVFKRAGLAYRRSAVIDTLRAEHKLTQRQFDGLGRYRDIAIADERSPVEDSVGKMMRGACGGAEGQSPFATRSALELARYERALGSLRNVARAIAVDDMTISAWAMSQNGALECDRRGVISFEPSKQAFGVAWMDLRMAGERLAAEMGA